MAAGVGGGIGAVEWAAYPVQLGLVGIGTHDDLGVARGDGLEVRAGVVAGGGEGAAGGERQGGGGESESLEHCGLR